MLLHIPIKLVITAQQRACCMDILLEDCLLVPTVASHQFLFS